ncbi:GCN5-like N-acetyltransferase [Shewanella piezotolerans WP3]|uniref:GCN5-like N-acetyltransferase n=1 Tax=Shewanella piezotolerans (strain WP3 / JCM 13877) TaxID=225849 RepID=B8CU13_SHEPW|nr:GNAT family N-acetyltransferase [Shewanella piezotolerans]ACJ30869.1 GCN5-like N-acetyltransferase [Shewanella piezotolerans WP3]
MKLRSIETVDWPSILEIQLECYPQIEPESLAVLQSKWRASPKSCFSLEIDNKVAGYCLAHPWILGFPPTLEQELGPITTTDTLYLHDIALSAKAQGKGAGGLILDQLMQFAKIHGFSNISLVAVQGADRYWQRQGFKVQEIDKDLSDYPADACYMVYTL